MLERMPRESPVTVSYTHLDVYKRQPLHSSPFGRSVGRGECPTSERISATLLRLPFYSDMTDAEMDLVVDALVEASS